MISVKTILVIIFYGLIPVGDGLDRLGADLKSSNSNVTVKYSQCYGWETFANTLIRRSLYQKIILIGHSCGAWAAIGVANEMNHAMVPVELLVTFDPPFTIGTIPPNVLVALNYKQRDGKVVGVNLAPAAGNHLSIILNIESDESHVGIAANRSHHAEVIRDIKSLTGR